MDSADDLWSYRAEVQSNVSRLPITAIKVISLPNQNLLLAGNGPHLVLLEEANGSFLADFRVFKTNAIHGIQVITESYDVSGYSSTVLVWGGPSLRVLNLHARLPITIEGISLSALCLEYSSPDWILDVAFCRHPVTEGRSVSNIRGCLITAHNVVFSLKVENRSDQENSATIKVDELGSKLRPILYSADITWVSPTHILAAAGTVFGHEGSIFGVDISPDVQIDGKQLTKRFVASCSDDRTIRIWDISSCSSAHADESNQVTLERDSTARGTGFHVVATNDLGSDRDTYLAKEWGHESRIWGISFLDYVLSDEFISFNLMSRAEDCSCTPWNFKVRYEPRSSGACRLQPHDAILKPIAAPSTYHVGKSIWSMELFKNSDSFNIYTGGADGNLVQFKVPLQTGMNSTIAGYSSEDIYNQLTLSGSIEAPDMSAQPKKRYGRITRFSFISDSCFIASLSTGTLLLGSLGLERSTKCSNSKQIVEWTKITELKGIGTIEVVSGISQRGIALIGTTTGQIWWYAHDTNRVGHLATTEQKVSDIHFIDLPNTYSTVSCDRIAFISSSRGLTSATFFIVSVQPMMVVAQKKLELPQGFEVSSAMSTSISSILVLGSRLGGLSIFSIDRVVGLGHIEPLKYLENVHDRDAVTSILCLNEDTSNDLINLDVVTVGRDGFYRIHHISNSTSQPSQLSVNVVHEGNPPIGSYLGGAMLKPENKDLLIWGFRGQHFTVWNETAQIQVLTIECPGDHKKWVYHYSQAGHIFLWIKAAVFNIASEISPCCRRIWPGGHGREIKTIAGSGLDHTFGVDRARVLATGAEDTEIRLYNVWGSKKERSDFQCVRTLKGHVAGLQHLQWDPDGKFLFSSAGKEEFYVWNIGYIPNFGISAVRESSAPTGRLISDLRITHFHVLRVKSEHTEQHNFLIAVVYSNSEVKVLWYSSSTAAKIFTTLAQGQYMDKCLTQIEICVTKSNLYLITGSTDGYLVIWDLRELVGSYFTLVDGNIQLKSNDLNPVATISLKWQDRRSVHQSSIKAMCIYSVSRTEIFIITGGDDNCLSFSTLNFSDIPRASNSVQSFSSSSYPEAHASAINDVSLIKSNERDGTLQLTVASSGNDQRAKIWNVSLNPKSEDDDKSSVQISLLHDVYTAVSDLSAMELYRTNRSGLQQNHLALCGVGMEILDIGACAEVL
ncbi:hypothetical protein FQN57_005312 [Myotisia sp. PD_48]|nr:hypothetical protein FQN57_005312 [Myotisia sp. PD_48]